MPATACTSLLVAGAEQSSVCITPVRIMPTDDSAASLGCPFCISVAVPTPCEAVPIETPHATSFEAVPQDRASVTPSPKAPPSVRKDITEKLENQMRDS